MKSQGEGSGRCELQHICRSFILVRLTLGARCNAEEPGVGETKDMIYRSMRSTGFDWRTLCTI